MADSEDNRSPHTVVVALLGGAIGVASAITALRVVGSDPAYRSRVFCGWIALLCALVAPWGVLLAGRHRKTAMALTLLGGAALLVVRDPHGGDSVRGVKKAICLPCRLADNPFYASQRAIVFTCASSGRAMSPQLPKHLSYERALFAVITLPSFLSLLLPSLSSDCSRSQNAPDSSVRSP